MQNFCPLYEELTKEHVTAVSPSLLPSHGPHSILDGSPLLSVGSVGSYMGKGRLTNSPLLKLDPFHYKQNLLLVLIKQRFKQDWRRAVKMNYVNVAKSSHNTSPPD